MDLIIDICDVSTQCVERGKTDANSRKAIGRTGASSGNGWGTFGTDMTGIPGRASLAVLVVTLVMSACTGRSLYVRPGVDPRCVGCQASLAQLDTRVLLIG